MATNVIQELVSRFVLDSKKYEEGGSKVEGVLRKINEGFEKTQEKGKEFARSLNEKLGIGEILAPLAALGSVVGLVDLGKDAVETAEKFDILERKVAGLTGSLDRAKQIMEFGGKEAGRTGLFKPEEIDEASIALEKFGLQAEKYVPMVEALSAVTGSGMEEFASALGMLAHGEGERALRVLERAGISKQDLMSRGLNISGENKVTSSPQASINAIGGAINDKYGGVLSQMLDSPTAKAAKASIAWEEAMEKIGQAIERVLVPAEEAISKGLDEISESGQLDKIVSGFEHLFSIDGNGLEGVIKMVADGLEDVPEKIVAIRAKIEEIWNWAEPKAKALAIIIAEIWATTKVIEFGIAVAKTYAIITSSVKAAAMAQAVLDALQGPVGWAILAGGAALAVGAYYGIGAAIDAATDSAQSFGAALDANAESARKMANAMKWNNANAEPQKPGLMDNWLGDAINLIVGFGDGQSGQKVKAAYDDWINSPAVKPSGLQPPTSKSESKVSDAKKTIDSQVAQTTYLAQIATNTNELLKETKKYSLGGGDLERIGVTPIEQQKRQGANRHLSAIGHGASHGTMAILADAMGRVLDERLAKSMAEYQRTNAFQR